MAAGCLSLLMLLKTTWQLGFSAPVLAILHSYELWMSLALGWSEPYLKSVLQELRGVFGWQLHLLPQWKHVFFLLWLYFSALARSTWALGGAFTFQRIGNHIDFDYWHGFAVGGRPLAIFQATAGIIIAAMIGVTCGTVPFTSQSLLATLIPVAVSMSGLALHGFLSMCWIRLATLGWSPQWKSELKRGSVVYVLGPIPLAVIGLIATATGFAIIHAFSVVNGRGLLLLGAFVLMLAVFHLFIGFMYAKNYFAFVHGSEGRRMRLKEFVNKSPAVTGLLMIATVLGVILFLALNAGLKSAGL